MCSRTEDPPEPPAVIDADSVPERTGSAYPEPFRGPVAGRAKRALGDAVGVSAFGVNLVELAPGACSALRHWHSAEDELVLVLEGTLTLVTGAGERELGPGMVAGFPAGRADGHQLVNRGDAPARYLEVGDRRPDDEVVYPDHDLRCATVDGRRVFTDRSGRPYD